MNLKNLVVKLTSHRPLNVILFFALTLTAEPALANQIQQISLGESHSCAILKDNTLKCWGQNRSGQLGLGHSNSMGDSTGEITTLSQVALGTEIISSVVSGGLHTCALFGNGKIKCWGNNKFGQLGLGDTENRGDQQNEMGTSLPYVDLGADSIVTGLSLGEHFTCALLSSNKIKCWGRNSSGQLGIESVETKGDSSGEMGNSLQNVKIGTQEPIQQIASGAMHSCALFTSGKIKCWGKGRFGQLGYGATENVGNQANSMGPNLEFLNFSTDIRFKKISLGFVQSCGLTMANKIKCWGYNKDGRLGTGDQINRGDTPQTPVKLLADIDLAPANYIEDFSCGSRHCCARLENNALKCWGKNHQGGLGLGDTMTRSSEPNQMGDELPYVNLGVLITVKKFSLGGGHSCAVIDDLELKCWGENRFGQLGLEKTTNHGDRPGTMSSRLPALKL